MKVSMIFLSAALLIAVFFDLRFGKIPNWLTYSTMLIAVAYSTWANGAAGLLHSVSGVIVGMTLLVIFYLLGGMGAGDVKLMGAVGALLGPKGVFAAFLATALIGGIYALILLASHGQLGKTINRYWLILKTGLLTRKVLYVPPSEGEKKPRLRYGVAIALGTILSVVMENSLYEMLHLN